MWDRKIWLKIMVSFFFSLMKEWTFCSQIMMSVTRTSYEGIPLRWGLSLGESMSYFQWFAFIYSTTINAFFLSLVLLVPRWRVLTDADVSRDLKCKNLFFPRAEWEEYATICIILLKINVPDHVIAHLSHVKGIMSLTRETCGNFNKKCFKDFFPNWFSFRYYRKQSRNY